jgi:hypothetical protein
MWPRKTRKFRGHGVAAEVRGAGKELATDLAAARARRKRPRSSVYGVLEGFGADGGAASERHCLMKAFLVLPSDRYMALWARQSCLHSLLLF